MSSLFSEENIEIDSDTEILLINNTKELRNQAPAISNFMQAPIYALSPKSAMEMDSIDIEWMTYNTVYESTKGKVIDQPEGVENNYSQNKNKKIPKRDEKGNIVKERVLKKFSFKRTTGIPLPILEHALIFDVFQCMFGSQTEKYRKNKRLYFQSAQVMRNTGKSVRSNALVISETVYRYQHNTMYFTTLYLDRPLKDDGTYQGSTRNVVPITNSSFTFNNKEKVSESVKVARIAKPKKRTGQRKDKKDWHWIEFHHEIVEDFKDTSNLRFIMTDVQKILKPSEYIVWRHYFGSNDMTLQFRKLEELRSGIFNWAGRVSRFKPWLEKQLHVLYQLGLIYKPYWRNEETLGVRCKSIREIKTGQCLKGLEAAIEPSLFRLYNLLREYAVQKKDFDLEEMKDKLNKNDMAHDDYAIYLEESIKRLEDYGLISDFVWIRYRSALNLNVKKINISILAKIDPSFKLEIGSTIEDSLEMFEGEPEILPKLEDMSPLINNVTPQGKNHKYSDYVEYTDEKIIQIYRDELKAGNIGVIEQKSIDSMLGSNKKKAVENIKNHVIGKILRSGASKKDLKTNSKPITDNYEFLDDKQVIEKYKKLLEDGFTINDDLRENISEIIKISSEKNSAYFIRKNVFLS